MNHRDHPDCLYCRETMTFARVAAVGGTRRDQSCSYACAVDTLRLERSQTRPKTEAHTDSLLWSSPVENLPERGC